HSVREMEKRGMPDIPADLGEHCVQLSVAGNSVGRFGCQWGNGAYASFAELVSPSPPVAAPNMGVAHGSAATPPKPCPGPGGQWRKSPARSLRSSSSTIAMHSP